MTNQDEILTEYVNTLKAQNESLIQQLEQKSKPVSFLGVAEMWIAFWTTVGNMWAAVFSTIGGIWKDFWSAISSMWSTFWNNEAVPVVGGILLAITVITCSLTWYHIKDLDRPIPKPTSNYFMTGDSRNGCYKVSQEMTNGEMRSMTPCIKDKDEALKTLKELKNIK